MAIRPATPDDLDEIIELIRALGDYEHMSDEVVLVREEVAAHLFGPEPAAHVLLSTEDATGEVTGFALWFRSFSTFLGRPGIWLEDLFVRPAHRGRGHGRALLDELRRSTDGRVEWAVLEWNRPSLDFYDALGARAVEGWLRYRWLPDAPDSPS